MIFARKKAEMTDAARALPGRNSAIATAASHFVNGNPLKGPYPKGSEQIIVAMGCYWGAERKFWELPGVWTTAVGYQGGMTSFPTYEETCTGLTGHTEAVRVVYDPDQVSFEDLLKIFWETHDPTQGYRQGNDLGTQYRSTLYWTTEGQRVAAEESAVKYQKAVTAAGLGDITTEIGPAPTFYYAEEPHQQYLAKVVNGYDCHANTGVNFPA